MGINNSSLEFSKLLKQPPKEVPTPPEFKNGFTFKYS